MSIRKFSKKPFNLDKLVEIGALRPQMAELLAAAVKARVTTIISGGTGSGKTTMLNALSSFISDKERLITIEDAAELQLQQPHVARMETRPPNVEGKGEIRQRDLVKNALRMRPERIILGECRGEEAFDMLQAMNTGHEGSMATIHANNPREAISRLEQMIGMAGLPMTHDVDPRPDRRRHAADRAALAPVRRQAARHEHRRDHRHGRRDPADAGDLQVSCAPATREDGTVEGHFQATGIRPRFLDRSRRQGHQDSGQLLRPQPAACERPPCRFDIDPLYLIYGFAAVSAILFAEGAYLLFYSTAVLSQAHQSPARRCCRTTPTARASWSSCGASAA